MLWVHDIQPAAWQMSLMQPIYKGGDKSKADPASHRGIYLSSALARLFEGILISRLTKFTETHVRWQRINSEHALADKSTMQYAACSPSSRVQYNISQKGLETYVAFCDFSTAFPSIYRGKLLSLLCKKNIVRRLWKHLRERFHTVKVRVLHPRIPKSSIVDILRWVPEGSRLSPTLFGIFVADLIHELKVQFQCNHHPQWGGGQVDRGNSSRWQSVSDLNWCSRTPDDDKHMSKMEWKGKDATQRWQNQNCVFWNHTSTKWNHTSTKCAKTTTKS